MINNNKIELSQEILNQYYSVYVTLDNIVNQRPFTRKEQLFYNHAWEDQHFNVFKLDSMSIEHIQNALRYCFERIIFKDMRQYTMYDWSLSFLVLFNEAIKRKYLPIYMFSEKNLDDIYEKIDIILLSTLNNYPRELAKLA